MRGLGARTGVALLCVAVAGCAGGDRAARREPAAPARPSGIDSPEIRQCLADLATVGARVTPLPDRDHGQGCSAYGSVRLDQASVPVSNLGPMRCPLARAFAGWLRHGVGAAARVYFGTDLARVESYGSYACRNINGAQAGRRSEHARANAVDIAAFVLADGRRISIKADWRSSDPQVRAFMAAIHASACKRFATVLGPDYNALHADHLHLDMGRGPFCR